MRKPDPRARPMKRLLPEILVLLTLVAAGGFAYQNHPPFRDLVDDITRYSGLMDLPPAPVPTVPAHNTPSSGGEQPGDKQPANRAPAPVTATTAPPAAATGNTTQAAAQARSENQTLPPAPARPVPPAPPARQTPPRPAAQTHAPTNPPDLEMNRRYANADAALAAARQAWYAGRLRQATALYNRFTREYADRPEFAGELGNIYMAGSQTTAAVDAYTEAVIRLLRNGDITRARQTLAIIQNLDRARADTLRQQYAPLR